MNNTESISFFFSLLMGNLPTLIVCFLAIVTILSMWKEGSSGSLWALIGFGLLFVLCLAMPAAQAAVHAWGAQNGDHAQRLWAFSALGIVGSVLHAAVYLLLLVAVFTGRPPL
ncbi:MAG: hypothetical protein PHD76_14855, partial [Methylacidiphilales bacterium]|nr:hypothetical protein [Candidatus Methylacidiphilales bacterium]